MAEGGGWRAGKLVIVYEEREFGCFGIEAR
jgi:hypothetical protein